MDATNKSAVPALRMTNISKRFPGVIALDDVSLELAEGEVLALVGENGAGKSTLMKILSGAYRADSGRLELFGKPVPFTSPLLMMRMGVAIIYQELLLAKDLSVAENIFLGRLPKNRWGLTDWQRINADAASLIERLGFDLDPRAKVSSLSVAQRQVVEIAKALSQNARILVLDEPSAVLGDAELAKLFEIIGRLSAEGVGFIYISHRLEEVFTISERTLVMRDGKVVGTAPTASLTRNDLVRMMVGRELSDIYPTRNPKTGPLVLEIEGLHNEALSDISVKVHSGEIVGICGMAGAGRSELLRAICGADPSTAARASINGANALFPSPGKSLAGGVGLLPEDRRKQGLFVSQDVAFNVSIANLGSIVRNGLLSRGAERKVVTDFVSRLRIKTPGISEKAANLSGGNQQKCVLAKLLNAECSLLLVDEPTRGVDIGAKREIYQVLADLADKEGIGIVMVSSELPEIIGMCDRVYVLRGGRQTGEFTRSDLTEENIMHAATA
ncbi:MAG: sugar ABC transporter ATP-binding protein [Hyphomicrobiaceae bacterium]|nr:sugar ABC transporter ATP-binding protein [Hyphomicrobiaceae bacterium]